MFVTKRRYLELELAYMLARKLAEERGERIKEQKRHIALLEEALALKTPPLTPAAIREREERTKEPIQTGRGSWRARAAAASDLTVPKPPDSVAALEARVKENGGKV